MKVVDVSAPKADVEELTGARLVAELEASPGVDRALVIMVRSGLSIIAERITKLEPGALAVLEAADLVDPEAEP